MVTFLSIEAFRPRLQRLHILWDGWTELFLRGEVRYRLG